MKTVTGRVISAEPISLSKAATILSGFVSSETEASQDVSAYLRRASAAFTELKSIHREIKSTKPRSEARHERNPTEEFEELGRAKGIDNLVENGEKIRSRESEPVTKEESIHGRKQDEIKEDKKKKKKSQKNKEEDVVEEKVTEEKLEDEQRNEERKEIKKKRKKNKEENVIDENVDVKLEEEQWNEEKKEKKKKKKSKKDKEEDVIDEKVNVKVEEEQRSEQITERKKKRKSDGEIGSEERKSKKKRKTKEIEG